MKTSASLDLVGGPAVCSRFAAAQHVKTSLSLILLFSSIACSSATLEESTDDLQSASFCNRVERPPAGQNKDHYLTFSSHEAAVEYARGFLAALGKQPPLATRNAALEAEVERVFKVFQAQYPANTEGMREAPRVVIVDDGAVNAFAGKDDRPEVNRSPWIVFVNRGLLENATENGRLGLCAHEMAHLILKNATTEVKEAIHTYYQVQSKEVLGALASNDDAVKKRVEGYRKHFSFVGDFADRSLSDLPTRSFTVAMPRYTLLMRKGLSLLSAASPNQYACTTARSTGREWETIFDARVSGYDYSFTPRDEERARLSELTQSFARSTEACLEYTPTSLLDLVAAIQTEGLPQDVRARVLAQVQQDPSGAAAELLTEEERSIDQTNASLGRKIFWLSTQHTTAMREVEAQPDWDKVREYTYEEEADDVSARILQTLGIDTKSSIDFLFSPEQLRECKATLASGKVPHYGGMRDPHHSTCYRLYHLEKVADTLARCR